MYSQNDNLCSHIYANIGNSKKINKYTNWLVNKKRYIRGFNIGECIYVSRNKNGLSEDMKCHSYCV